MRTPLLLAAILSCATAAADEKYVTIRGQVKWNGEKAPDVVLVNLVGHADQAACCKGAATLLSNRVVVDPKSLGVKSVIVWLRPDDDDRTKTFPLDTVKAELKKPKSVEHVIDQPKCQFEPRVLAARTGDTLVVKNSSALPHNVNMSSNAEDYNVIIQAGKEYKPAKALEAQLSPILFKCDVHKWMEGRIRVFDHPYYATTDKDGKFEIKDAPVGKWRIAYWHEGGFHTGAKGNVGFPITIKGDKAVQDLDPIKLELPNK